MISLKEFEQIKKCQLEAFDVEVENSVKSLSWRFLYNYNRSPHQSEYIINEIEKIGKLVDEDLNHKGYVLSGYKDYLCIKGSDYRRIMGKSLLLKKGKLKFTIERLNNNMRITFLYKYLQWLKKFQLDNKTDSRGIKKDYPPLLDCFIDENYFPGLLKNPRIEDHYTNLKDGSYNWTSTKEKLGGLAVTLLDQRKINPDIIRTHQDLARVFCPFFNVEFDPKVEKAFQKARIDTEDFKFIK